jgi:hypothetical protein
VTTALIVGGVVVVLIVLAVVLISTRYGKVYSDSHLFEVCEALDRIRDHGCARPEWDDEQELPGSAEEVLADMRNAETKGGLRLSYTVTASREKPERHRHCVSMSQADRLPAEAMARFFVGLVLVRYGLPVDAVAVARSQNLVTHMMWEIPADERLKFAAAKIEVPDSRHLNELRKAAAAAGRAVKLQQMDVQLAA